MLRFIIVTNYMAAISSLAFIVCYNRPLRLSWIAMHILFINYSETKVLVLVLVFYRVQSAAVVFCVAFIIISPNCMYIIN